jgi:threonylcarbamoyladenosine tRNA methylthiotransferase MtaB
MPDQVPVHVARERNRMLRELAAEKNLVFRQSFVGRTLEVITLQAGGDGWTEALSDNFLKVRLAGRHEANQWMKAYIGKIGDEDLLAMSPEQAALVV